MRASRPALLAHADGTNPENGNYSKLMPLAWQVHIARACGCNMRKTSLPPITLNHKKQQQSLTTIAAGHSFKILHHLQMQMSFFNVGRS
ncbi:hypothetical protein [Herbaspirillum robiniae]|uniref:hypothetical protein n=1 Tax=Herbaspirillum robiniae TaxID=2014887 RepID=UPI00101ADB97|nr:hypothetical protein [Herbaspirillum robiniae]